MYSRAGSYTLSPCSRVPNSRGGSENNRGVGNGYVTIVGGLEQSRGGVSG